MKIQWGPRPPAFRADAHDSYLLFDLFFIKHSSSLFLIYLQISNNMLTPVSAAALCYLVICYVAYFYEARAL